MTSSTPFARGAVSGVIGTAAVILSILSLVEGKRKQRRQKMVEKRRRPPKNYGGAIKLKPEMYGRYTQLHDAVWNEVLCRLRRSNIRNFVIYYHKEKETLFSHFEWIGHWHLEEGEDEDEKFEADMEAIRHDPAVKEWWKFCETCQEPFSQFSLEKPPPSRGGRGDWWAPLPLICHCGHWPVEYAKEDKNPDFIPNNPSGLTSTRASPPFVESRSKEVYQ